jgi:peptidyl-dipeptidase A
VRKTFSCAAAVLFALSFQLIAAQAKPTVADAQTWMDKAEAELLDVAARQQRATWVEQTYITGDTEKIAAEANDNGIARTTRLVEEAKRFADLDLPAELKRKFDLLKLSLTLPAPNDPKLRSELTEIASWLEGAYGSGKYCPGNEPAKCLGIDDLDERMAQNRDPKTLQDLWQGWHNVGAPMRDKYARFVELSNQGARELGFADTGVMWRSGYDMTPEQFSSDLERLWQQVKPL